MACEDKLVIGPNSPPYYPNLVPTFTTYRERNNSLSHFAGPNAGTPTTMCGLDAGDMERREHPVDHAGVWCTECMNRIEEARA